MAKSWAPLAGSAASWYSSVLLVAEKKKTKKTNNQKPEPCWFNCPNFFLFSCFNGFLHPCPGTCCHLPCAAPCTGHLSSWGAAVLAWRAWTCSKVSLSWTAKYLEFFWYGLGLLPLRYQLLSVSAQRGLQKHNSLEKLRDLPTGFWLRNLKRRAQFPHKYLGTVGEEGKLELNRHVAAEWGVSGQGLIVWSGFRVSPCTLILVSPQMPRCWKENLKILMYLPILLLLQLSPLSLGRCHREQTPPWLWLQTNHLILPFYAEAKAQTAFYTSSPLSNSHLLHGNPLSFHSLQGQGSELVARALETQGMAKQKCSNHQTKSL